MPGAAGVRVSTAPIQGAGRSSSLTAALQDLAVHPIPFAMARDLLVREHYRHSLPGGSVLAFGVFVGPRLRGALTFGSGPTHGHRLVEGAQPDDGITLTRLWLGDGLPKNGESRVLGIILRALRRETPLKFVLTYADPSAGHLGGIYQATNFMYTGLGEAMPLFDLGDGVLRHSRSLGHSFGSHGIAHFARHGVTLRTLPQARKHRYVYFLDPTWRSRLRVPVLPYPKREEEHGDH